MKIVLINGPKRSGKNTLATLLKQRSNDSEIIGFSHHLKRCVHAMHFGRAGWDMDPDEFDAVKGVRQAMLGGMTWREAYINFSEYFVKPTYGDEWFGEKFVESAHGCGAGIVWVPDSGFRGEAMRTVREWGADNVLLARLYRDGCTYEGDSRGYISLADLGVREIEIHNNGAPGAMLEAVAPVLAEFLHA